MKEEIKCKVCGDTVSDNFDLCGNCLAMKHINDYREKHLPDLDLNAEVKSNGKLPSPAIGGE